MKLTRSSNGMIGGVAAGIAKSLNVDPTLIRIAFVLVSLFAGGGVLLYLILWAVIPKEGANEQKTKPTIHGDMSFFDAVSSGDVYCLRIVFHDLTFPLPLIRHAKLEPVWFSCQRSFRSARKRAGRRSSPGTSR